MTARRPFPRMWQAVFALVLVTGCRLAPDAGTIRISLPSAAIKQEEGQDRPTVDVAIPVLGTPEGAKFSLTRDGQAVTFEASPSATFPGMTELVESGAPYSTRLAYAISAAFPGGATATSQLTITLARTLLSFPTLAEPRNGATSVGTAPKFRWNTQGLASANLRLEVIPESGPSHVLLMSRNQAEFDWRDPATSSVTGGVSIPRSLFSGVRATARVVAYSTPVERSDSTGNRTLVTEESRSKAITFTP